MGDDWERGGKNIRSGSKGPKGVGIEVEKSEAPSD